MAPNVSEIATLAVESRTGRLADDMSKHIPLLLRLSEKGQIDEVDGGRVIYQEIDYAENPSYKRYRGWEPLSLAVQPTFSAAEYEIKQAAMAIQVSGLEELQVSGEEGVIKIVAARGKNAERSFKNNLDGDLHSDGTADGGKQIGGLQHLIADTPTSGTVGGIDASLSANSAFWRNISLSAASDLGIATLSAANIQRAMNKVAVQLRRNNESFDMVIADDIFWLYYFESLTPGMQMMGNKSLIEKKIQTVPYWGADVIHAGGVGGNAQASRMRFINSDYLFWRPHARRNMTPIGGDRVPVNQDGTVKFIGLAGALTTSNRRMHGLLKP